MAVEIQGEVGHFNNVAGGSKIPAMTHNRGFKQADSQARFQDAVLRGNVFIGANIGSVTTQAGLSATTPALTLFNPPTSGVLLSIWTTTIGFTAAPAAACLVSWALNTVVLASSGVNTGPITVTNATITNALLGDLRAPRANCYVVATLAVAPVNVRYLGGTTGAAAIGGVQLIDHIDGEMILLPGACISIQTSSAAALRGSVTWEEIPLSAGQ